MIRFLGHWAAMLFLLTGTLAMLLDAAAQKRAQRARTVQVQTIVSLLGTADMALSGASRWLRHPSLAEPGAAFADAPALLDADPAGGLIAPPRALLRAPLGGLPEPAPLETPP